MTDKLVPQKSLTNELSIELTTDVKQLIQSAKQRVAVAVNSELTLLY